MYNSILHKKVLEESIMIMTHRGLWGGNIIQNTRQAAQLAVKAGSDIVEIDVCRSRDGQYYLFHNGTEQELIGIDKDFTELTSEEIDKLVLKNSFNQPSGFYVEYMKDFLDWLPKDYLVNIDRSWDYWDDKQFFDILKQSGKVKQLIIKSPAKESILQALNESGIEIMYVPITYRQADLDLVDTYPNIYRVGVELIVNQLTNHELLDTDWLSQLKKDKQLIIANSEHLGDKFRLFDQLNDTEAVLGEEEAVWGKMIDLGINVIQTDWPNFLAEYRKQVRA